LEFCTVVINYYYCSGNFRLECGSKYGSCHEHTERRSNTVLFD
jgi:hypothetical protein